MDEYGHGDHWKCITNLEDLMNTHLENFVSNGKVQDAAKLLCLLPETGFQTEETFISIVSPEPDLSAKALLAVNEKNKSNDFVSGYPFIKQGFTYRLKIENVHEWPNMFEAVIETTTEDDMLISFFDTNYYLNKDKYKIGEYYEFTISALAYQAELVEKKSFSLIGEDAREFYEKTKRTPDFDKDGNMDPVTFDISQLVTFLSHEKFLDDHEFQSPILKVSEVSIFGEDLYKIKILIYKDPDIPIHLFVKQSFFNKKPRVKEPIAGLLWMQGYLKD